MAVPAIDPTQSIPDFNQWQSWGLTLGCDNDPTSWSAARLPPGVSINSTTGLISGAATLPGPYNFDVTAHNADGASAPARFTVGIRPAPQPIAAGAVEALWDLQTNALTFPGLDAKTGPVVKRGDDLYLHLRMVRGSLGVDVPVETLRLNAKNEEALAPLLTGSTWTRTGTGENTVYLLYVALAFTDSVLNAGAEDTADPDAAAQIADPSGAVLARSLFADLLAELEMTADRAWSIGPSTPRVSTQTFPLRVVRDLSA